MINLSLDELKLVATNRGIKDYKNKSKDHLIKILGEPKTKINLPKKRIEDIKKDVNKPREIRKSLQGIKNQKNLFKLKIKQIRKSPYDIKSPKNLSKLKIKQIRKSHYGIKNLSKSEMKQIRKNLSKSEINQIRKSLYDIKIPKNLSKSKIKKIEKCFSKDYYNATKTKSAFNGNYLEYESKGDKDKNLSPEEYLDMIRPYLSDIINDHKTPKKLKFHSSNGVADYETQFAEWKIQLTMQINFISSKDSGETRTMYTNSRNVETMTSSETNDIIEELRESLL